MRIATYNVEWFDVLFDDDGNLLYDNAFSGRRDVRRAEQIEALAMVFRRIDADAIMVIEAPDTSRRRSGVRALLTFAETFGLRTREALIGYANDTQQEIILLYDPDRLKARHDPWGKVDDSREAPRFDGRFRIDLDFDGREDVVTWSKPPLEVAAVAASGRAFRMIGVHAKSKAPSGARDHEEVVRLAIENRRKQLAQCIWLRGRVDEVLAAGESLIVLGDFNDGPGLDEYEKLFGRSGVEIVLGENGAVRLHDPHARQALTSRLAVAPATARFRIPPDGAFLSAMLDYIMISPDLCALEPHWRIWHPFDDPECYRDVELREALLLASDHFPVTLDIDL